MLFNETLSISITLLALTLVVAPVLNLLRSTINKV